MVDFPPGRVVDFPPLVPTAAFTFQGLLDYNLILLSGYSAKVGILEFPKRCLIGSAANVTLEILGYGTQHIKFARYSDYNNHYHHLHDTTLAAQDHKLYKFVAGAATQLGQEAVDLDKWTQYRYKFELSGTSLKCYRTDMVIPKISVVDGAHATGKYGVGCYLSDSRWADQKFFEVKVNGTDYDEAISLANVLRWHLFPAKYHQTGQHVNTIIFKGSMTDGWTEIQAEGQFLGASVRFSDHANHYWVDTKLTAALGDFVLGKSVNAVETILGTEAVNLNRFDLHKYRVSVAGTTLKGYRDDVEKFSVVDTAIASGVRAFFTWENEGDEYVHAASYG